MTATSYLTEANIGGNDYKLTSALFGISSTAKATRDKTVSIDGIDELVDGLTITVAFENGNDDHNAPTLNVNGLGAKGIIPNAKNDYSEWPGGITLTLVYISTATWGGIQGAWVVNNYNYWENTLNTAGSANSTSKLYLIGATGQTSAGQTTYSNANVYETNGYLYATGYNDVQIDGSTGIELTAGSASLVISDDYTLGDACEAGIDTSISSGSTSTNLPTTQAVADYVDSAVAIASSGALTYKGVATALTDITNTSYKQGWYWMVGSNPSITIDGQACEAGDMIIAKQDKTTTADNDLDVIQTNIETLTNGEIDTLWAAA